VDAAALWGIRFNPSRGGLDDRPGTPESVLQVITPSKPQAQLGVDEYAIIL